MHQVFLVEPKMEYNPWLVESFKAFSCLECNFISRDDKSFREHALENHPLSSALFGKEINEDILTENVNVLTGLPENVNYLPEHVNNVTYHADGYAENVKGLPENVNDLTENVNGLTENGNGLSENVNSLPENVNVLIEDVNVLTEKEIKIEVCFEEKNQKASPGLSPNVQNNSHTVKNPRLIKSELIFIETEPSDDLNGLTENVNGLIKNVDDLTENVNALSENFNADETENQQENYQNVESVPKVKKLFSCQICAKDFSQKVSLKKHNRSVHEGKIWDPKSCCEGISSKASLKRHIETVHGNKKSLKCSECDKNTFRDNSDLKQHMERVHKKSISVQEEKKSCQICATDFLGKIALKRHIKFVHEGKEPNSCKICGQVFTRYLGLKRHIEFVHGGKKILKCSECDRDTFRNNSDLKAHIELVHRKSILFECGHCGKKLSNLNSKERHERKFPNALCIKMPFECELCPYRNQFKLRDSLYRHIKNFHKGENATTQKENVKKQKPFSCVKCKKNFSSMDLLKSHTKKNCVIMILKCKYCDKKFLKRKILTVHERYKGATKEFLSFEATLFVDLHRA